MDERTYLGHTWGADVFLVKKDDWLNPRVVIDWNGNEHFEMAVMPFLDVAEWVEDEMDEPELALR